MSEKKNLEREIRVLEEEINILEVKRSRSQSSLIEALISHTDPSEEEMQFFRAYCAEIDVKREQLTKLTSQLAKLR